MHSHRTCITQSDSKLLSRFPWHIILKLEPVKVKPQTEYESETQKALFGNAVLVEVISSRKYNVMPQNGTAQKETVYYRLSMEIICLWIISSIR